MLSVDSFSNLGFDIVELISDTHRNQAYRLRQDGQDFFGKFSLTKDARVMQNDTWWCLTMTRILENDPDAPLATPQLIASGEGWQITNWIDAPLVQMRDWHLQPLPDASIAKIADIISYLDQFRVPLNQQVRDRTTNTAPFHYLGKKLDEWAAQPLAEGILTANQLQQAKQVIARYQPMVQPGLQHGDFVPWHMFDLNNGKYCIFDGEHSGLLKPRFYDLAYMYSRLWTRGTTPESVKLLPQLVAERLRLKAEDFYQLFVPVLTQRAIGVHYDVVKDRNDSDYSVQAQDLLQRCLSGDFRDLW